MSGQPAMRIDIADHKGGVRLYLVRQQPLDDLQIARTGSYLQGTGPEGNVVAWNRGDCVMILTGDRSFDDLRAIADRL